MFDLQFLLAFDECSCFFWVFQEVTAHQFIISVSMLFPLSGLWAPWAPWAVMLAAERQEVILGGYLCCMFLLAGCKGYLTINLSLST